MPHMFTNRPRLHNLAKGRTAPRSQFRWETVNAVLYILGGVTFMAGSLCFFPSAGKYADWGAWIFLFGSLLYLVVTLHDWAEVRHHWRTIRQAGSGAVLEFVAATSYVLGTVLFTVGSVFFLSAVGQIKAGAWCFVAGSVLFIAGACINALQIVKSRNMLILQLMNITAVTFIIGAVLFTVASIPYLWDMRARQDIELLHVFLAWQYLAGSLFFLLGGVSNFWRASVVSSGEIEKRDALFSPLLDKS